LILLSAEARLPADDSSILAMMRKEIMNDSALTSRIAACAFLLALLLLAAIVATGSARGKPATVQLSPRGEEAAYTADRPLAHANAHRRSIEKPIPRVGSQPLLVILVDFPDRPGLFTGVAWHEHFFDDAGFADYYREVSYNQLRYSGDIVGIDKGSAARNSDEIAYVRLPHPLTYYADGSYGFDVSGGQFPQNHGGVVTHALQALDDASFRFARYANPATNEIENLVIIFAGSSYAYTRDANNSLEATAYRLAFAGGGIYRTSSGHWFDNYTFCPDQFGNLSGELARVGVCAHEHGHALGRSDLYDFSYTTTGAGNYDLMAYGTFGATEGLRPFHFGAFAKEFLGWSRPAIAASGVTTMTLGPTAEENNLVKLVPFGDRNSAEYFLLENRQPLGFEQDWSAAGLCAGLLIWHVDRHIVAEYPYAVNTLTSAGGPPHPGVTVMEADGGFDLVRPPLNYGDCTDTWQPGQRWDDHARAGAKLWDGRTSGLAVDVLSGDAGILTLRVAVEGLSEQLYLPFILRE